MVGRRIFKSWQEISQDIANGRSHEGGLAVTPVLCPATTRPRVRCCRQAPRRSLFHFSGNGRHSASDMPGRGVLKGSYDL